ncbi:AAA-like domain-containing protein [Desulfothermus sp.]
MKYFNTAGPVRCDEHYCLPPLERLELEEVLMLIDQKKYFVLHAPRQTGKTSCLLALMEYLNNQGKYNSIYINVEVAQAARENVYEAMDAILYELSTKIEDIIGDDFLVKQRMDILRFGPHTILKEALRKYCIHSQKPVVLMIDEIDSLIGDTLISVLRQLRAGYTDRPKTFPQSIILCGVRDVRDYRIHSSQQKEVITGGSAFNIKAESLHLGDFNKGEISILYSQHTEETGQEFEEGVIDYVWELTEGQPWLVNALGYVACFEIKQSRDRSKKITKDIIEEAKERIIIERYTHIDQLADKLREERVKKVIERILIGEEEPEDIPVDDILYVRDLGLIKTRPSLRISNKIYQEVIPRELTFSTQLTITQDAAWYVREDGFLDMDKLMRAFQEFFREHSESWIERFDYKEAGPQLLLQAFLQRIVNSGGRIYREYGLGKRRTDLLVVWPTKDNNVQKIVIELKILRKSLDKVVAEGLKQTKDYMDKCSALEGHLVIFDKREGISWDEKIFEMEKTVDGKKIKIWGM